MGTTAGAHLVCESLGSLHGGNVGVHEHTLDVAVLECLDGLGA